MPEHVCINCRYCDKESVLVRQQWVRNGNGYCLAEGSAVNTEHFYQEIDSLTTPWECAEFEPTRP